MTDAILSLLLNILSGALVVIALILAAGFRLRRAVLSLKASSLSLEAQYRAELYRFLDSEEPVRKVRFPLLGSPIGASTLTLLISKLAAQLYGRERERLLGLFRDLGLEKRLCNDICRADDAERANLLRFYTEIVPTFDTLKQITGFLRSENPDVRLYALLAHLNYCPEKTADMLMRYPHELTLSGQKEICRLLAARFVPVSDCCRRLLESGRKNCVLLGLSMIAYFDLQKYRPVILELVDSLDPAIRDGALRVLVIVRFSQIDGAVYRALDQMGEHDRKMFYRMLVRAQYSTPILSRFAKYEGDSPLAAYLNLMISGHTIPLRPIAATAH
ncbi:MAG: hypothetical protein IJC16_03680 [Rikenellaceae bacterium]|nr:hypothetical protein [Rikenellaceae bacterium]